MDVKVKFIRTVYIKKGQNALEAATEGKMKIKAPCKGKGKCGKCIIRIIDGSVSEPSKQEKKLLSKEKLSKGYRLACETIISKDAIIKVPEKS